MLINEKYDNFDYNKKTSEFFASPYNVTTADNILKNIKSQDEINQIKSDFVKYKDNLIKAPEDTKKALVALAIMYDRAEKTVTTTSDSGFKVTPKKAQEILNRFKIENIDTLHELVKKKIVFVERTLLRNKKEEDKEEEKPSSNDKKTDKKEETSDKETDKINNKEVDDEENDNNDENDEENDNDDEIKKKTSSDSSKKGRFSGRKQEVNDYIEKIDNLLNDLKQNIDDVENDPEKKKLHLSTLKNAEKKLINLQKKALNAKKGVDIHPTISSSLNAVSKAKIAALDAEATVRNLNYKMGRKQNPNIVQKAKGRFDDASNAIKNKLKDIKQNTSVGRASTTSGEALKRGVKTGADALKRGVKSGSENLKRGAETIKRNAPTATSSIKKGISAGIDKVKDFSKKVKDTTDKVKSNIQTKEVKPEEISKEKTKEINTALAKRVIKNNNPNNKPSQEALFNVKNNFIKNDIYKQKKEEEEKKKKLGSNLPVPVKRKIG